MIDCDTALMTRSMEDSLVLIWATRLAAAGHVSLRGTAF
jgi:hypothetical protein